MTKFLLLLLYIHAQGNQVRLAKDVSIIRFKTKFPQSNPKIDLEMNL